MTWYDECIWESNNTNMVQILVIVSSFDTICTCSLSHVSIFFLSYMCIFVKTNYIHILFDLNSRFNSVLVFGQTVQQKLHRIQIITYLLGWWCQAVNRHFVILVPCHALLWWALLHNSRATLTGDSSLPIHTDLWQPSHALLQTITFRHLGFFPVCLRGLVELSWLYLLK